MTSLAELAEVAGRRNATEQRTAELVAAARADGATWQQIGQALGVTRQAAQMRYGRKDPHR